MEAEFGLTSFIGDRKEAVDCVLKRLYSDFIVQEVNSAGEATRLLTFDEVRAETKKALNGDPQKVDESVERPDCVQDDFITACTAVYERTEKEARLDTKDLDKPSRTAIHVFLRSRYSDELESVTEGNGVIVVKRRKPGKRKRWARDTPPHTHFTMAKENKETSYAIGIVAKMSGCNPGLFKTCGLKDRRAVTSQRVSAFQVDMDKLLGLNNRLRGIVLYDFSYEREPVKTGSHWGNRFSIVLRDIAPESEQLLKGRLEEWAEKGFINYFGTQRFGSCETRTADVGRLILQRKWKEAVDLVLGGSGRNGQDTVQRAVEEWRASGDAGAAVKMLFGAQSYASVEGSLLKSLSKGKTWQEAVLYLPPNIRSIYIHAYQSLLWNKLASDRMDKHGMAVLEGDVNGDAAPLSVDAATPFDIHIPLANSACSDKQGYAYSYYESALKADELTWDSFRTLEKNFSLGDASRLSLRPLFVQPGKLQWKFVRTKTNNEQVQRDLTQVPPHLLEDKQEGDHLALWTSFDLPSGCYATVALREITACDMGKHYQRALNNAGDKATEDTVEEEVGEAEVEAENGELPVEEEDVSEEPVKKEPKLAEE